MEFRPARTLSSGASRGTAGLVSTAVEPEIPPAVAKRIATAGGASRSKGTRKTYAAALISHHENDSVVAALG